MLDAKRNMRIIGRALIAVGSLITFVSFGSAAEISALPPINGVTVVLIKGEIDKGDSREFRRLTENQRRVLVALSSPGGAVDDALAIGAEIRTQGFATSVADECASACALIWLSGVRRYLNPNASVGFHAAYIIKNGMPVETGMGNADIGSFLTHLGLSREAIQFVTAAPPEGVRWLTRDDAQRLGIAIEASGPHGTNLGGPQQPPAYITKPVTKNSKQQQSVEIAVLASHLVIALECARIYRIDTQYLKDTHSELMKRGERLGAEFVDFLGDELTQRAKELKRDGLDRFCSAQRERFMRAGLTRVYLN